MNIKITKEQFYKLRHYVESEHIFGSHLYQTATDKSDKDILLLLDNIFISDYMYPNVHCFQFDDLENNIQYMITTYSTFNKNLLTGESNIFAELVLFTDDFDVYEKLPTCRTYKIIKGFIGRAKFDLKLLGTSKDKKNRKSFHISRCLYIAECLLDNQLPMLNRIDNYINFSKEELVAKEFELRTRCNKMFESDELLMYPVFALQNGKAELNEFEQLLIESNNVKEFQY